MKIVLIGESLSIPSGFGGQLGILAEGLVKRGHNVIVLSSSAPPKSNLPENLQEWRVADLNNLENLDSLIHKIQPDAVICFWYLAAISHLGKLRSVAANCPVFYWLAWEGTTLPEHYQQWFLGFPANSIVHLSEFARNLWEPIFKSKDTHVIPHAVDPEKFDRTKTKESKADLREKWSDRLRMILKPKSLIVLNIDRNMRHKRWDATYAFTKKLSSVVKCNVQLVAHCQVNAIEESNNWHHGYDLKKLEEIYELQSKVVYTGFSWEKGLTTQELCELFLLSDFRISTSEGEGFGIPTIEAACLEVPQIVNNHTTINELLGDDYPWAICSSFSEYDPTNGALWQVPNVEAMVSIATDLYKYIHDDSDVLKHSLDSARNYVLSKFDSETVCNSWDKLLTESVETYQDKKPWYKCRYGHFSEIENLIRARDLALTVRRMCAQEKRKVLQVGCYDGKFLEFAGELGLDIIGIEDDTNSLDRMSSRAKLFIKQIYPIDVWPKASILILTDFVQRWLQGKSNTLEELLNKLPKYEWILIRNKTLYKWGEEYPDLTDLPEKLKSLGLVRRHDAEMLAKKFEDSAGLDHEIWSTHSDVKIIPKGLLPAS